MSQNKLTTIRNLFMSFQSKLSFFERRFMKKIGVKDVTPTELKTLYVIQLSEDKTMTGIADKLKITQGTLTITINSLEKKGYVVRTRMDHDRRIISLSLTKKSIKVIEYYEKFHYEIIDQLIVGLDDEKKFMVEELLTKLNTLLISK